MVSRQKDDYFDTAELLERGWTEALIGRFLGDADREGRSRSGQSDGSRQLYKKNRVLAREQDAAVERALRRVEQRRARKMATGRRMRQRDFSLFKEYFPRARALERRFVFFCGPTNSGKTYHALNALCEHTSGVYLAPLRLLALEGQEEIERRGKLCSLLTGDERDLKPEAQFRAQTIESLNYDEEVEAILIDEVQMLIDEQRGEHWVSAMIGAPAATIYLAGSPEALAYVQQICTYVEGSLEVHSMERLTPLHVDTHKRSLAEALAAKGQKAFIVFSRQSVFDLKDAVEAQGQQAAVIYGSLGPAVRRKEAERFRGGDCPILIATDAIGMGLNLPIDRLYFVTTRKWDGTQERPLTPTEVRQIAGRAGRYKKSRTGVVGAVFEADIDRVRWAIESPLPVLPVRRFRLGLTLPLAQELAQVRNTESLAKVMEFFSVMTDSSGLFQPQIQPQVIRLAALLDEYPSLPFDVKYRLAFAPVNTDDPLLFDEYKSHIDQLARHRGLNFADDLDDTRGTMTLLEAERVVKLYTLRLWFAFQYADAEDIELLEQRRNAANTTIEGFLQAKAKHHRKRCRVCGRVLPRFSSYGLCQQCFSRGRHR